MNEDITQEIYYLMKEAGFEEKEAQYLCDGKIPRMLYETELKKAKDIMRENLIEDFKFFAGILDGAN